MNVVKGSCAALIVCLVGISGSLVASEVDIVATVGDRSISRTWLEAAVDRQLNSGFQHNMTRQRENVELHREQLQLLIERELQILGGLDAGLELPLEAAEEQRQLIEINMGKKAYTESLKTEGLTKGSHRAMLAESLLAKSAYSRLVLGKVDIRESDIRRAYDSNLERWRIPDEIQVEHILIRVPVAADDETVAQQKARADEALQRLHSGEDFASVARKYSDDDYRIKGGALGWVHRGRLLPVLEDTLWTAENGAIIGPVKSDTGFHLARVTDRRDSRILKFEEVKTSLENEIKTERIKTLKSAWLDEVRSRHPVTILDPTLKE